MMLYISTKKISHKVPELLSGHNFYTKIYNGGKFHKNISRIMVLVLCTSPDNAFYLYQVSLKYLKGVQSD